MVKKIKFLDKFLVECSLFESKMRERLKAMGLMLPGAVLILMSFCLLLAPELAIVCLAFFFLALGTLIVWSGYKLNQLRNKFGKVSAQIEAKLMLDPSVLEQLHKDKFANFESRSSGDTTRLGKTRKSSADSGTSDLSTELLIQLGDSKKITYH